MRDVRMTPLGATTFAVRVDSYDQGAMTGVVDSVLLSEPLEFNSTAQLVLQLDELLDNEGPSIVKAESGSSFVSTFELDILFRRHHSWQGRIRLIQGGREATFKSVLELIGALEMMLGD